MGSLWASLWAERADVPVPPAAYVSHVLGPLPRMLAYLCIHQLLLIGAASAGNTLSGQQHFPVKFALAGAPAIELPEQESPGGTL